MPVWAAGTSAAAPTTAAPPLWGRGRSHPQPRPWQTSRPRWNRTQPARGRAEAPCSAACAACAEHLGRRSSVPWPPPLPPARSRAALCRATRTRGAASRDYASQRLRHAAVALDFAGSRPRASRAQLWPLPPHAGAGTASDYHSSLWRVSCAGKPRKHWVSTPAGGVVPGRISSDRHLKSELRAISEHFVVYHLLLVGRPVGTSVNFTPNIGPATRLHLDIQYNTHYAPALASCRGVCTLIHMRDWCSGRSGIILVLCKLLFISEEAVIRDVDAVRRQGGATAINSAIGARHVHVPVARLVHAVLGLTSGVAEPARRLIEGRDGVVRVMAANIRNSAASSG